MSWQSISQYVYLEQFYWLVATLFVYVLATKIFKYFAHNMLFHPILLGAILISGLAILSGTQLADYQQFVSPFSWMLGPITVALAIPLYQQIRLISATGKISMLVIAFGGCVAPVLALGCLLLFDFSEPVKMSILTKSITTPLAVDTANIIGAIPELAIGVVLITGIIGVMFSQVIFKLTRCDDPRAQGLALGTISHAIGTAHAHQVDAKSGAFATMALCVNGILTAIILPLVFMLFA